MISLVHLNCSFAQWTGQEVWPWPWGGLLSKGLFYKDSSSLTLFGPLLVPWNWLGPGECFEGVCTVKISPPSPLLEPRSRPSSEEQSDAFLSVYGCPLSMIPFKPWKAFCCILRNDVFPAPHLIWTPFHALKLTASWIACRLFLCCVLTSSPHWPASYLGPRKNNTIYY